MSKSLRRVFCVFTTAVLMGAVAHAQGGASGSEAVAAQVDKIFAPFDKPITIRHLLHHTSGLRDQWELLIMSGWRLSEDVVRKAGAYWASNTEELGRVTLTGDKLFFAFDGGNFELIPLSEKRFKISAPDGEVTFESPSEGARRMVITLAGRSPVILGALAPATPNAGQLAEYAGFYYSDEIDSIYKLTIQDGKLTVKPKKHGSVEMRPVAKDVFTTAGSGSIRFTRDKQNRVTGMVYSRGRIKNFRFDRLSSQYHER